jgi:ABC-type multidrug transport system ATPase subunit
MTLLLGPPSSGKTTLLLALAGKLGKDLKVRSHGFSVFVFKKLFFAL